METVKNILDGISTTAKSYSANARYIWIATLCIGTLIVIFGNTPAQGMILIFLMLVFLPAYFIDQSREDKAKKRIKHKEG